MVDIPGPPPALQRGLSGSFSHSFSIPPQLLPSHRDHTKTSAGFTMVDMVSTKDANSDAQRDTRAAIPVTGMQDGDWGEQVSF